MVETPEGRRVLCHLRGKKNELVVGDHVRWQGSGDEGVVEQVEPRRNLLFRQDAWRTKSFAANLDQLLMLVAGEPVFGESQLARALIAAQAAGIPALIGLNKTDLPSAAAARERLRPYGAMGLEIVELALKKSPAAARERLLPRLAGRTTLVLGASGMGKSTLINLLVPQAEAQVGEISQALGTGRHTTSATTWYWLDAERRGALIDSPGFQEFGLRQIAPERLATLMPDFAAALGDCRFHNCTHRHEPGCGVRAAMARGEISASRVRIYEELFGELSQKQW
ncbi:MAG: ribosome small subunit-dependent GTPase A [Burkholderiales bacterium]|nr:ribosome small subunit-dependent GTPase A [Burkholderiales bacterium]MDE2564682.1 ribosome small subunit-dependent GTPase A [Burkholderiales bacterium]